MLRLLLCASTVICLSQAYEYTVKVLDPATLPPDTRIVGGTATTIQNYPYTVQVAQNRQLMCGGSLITRRHVMSAAHCFVNANGVVTNPQLITIRAQTSNLNSGGVTRSVSVIVVHERYNRVTLDSDIAVMLLASAVSLSDSELAAIPVQGAVLPFNTVLVHVGWGHTVAGVESSAQILQEVRVLKVNSTLCRQRYELLTSASGLPYTVTDTMICAGLMGIGGADACQGDSGGPLITDQNRNLVVGITSWGFTCGHPDFPGVNARVSNFTNWITDTVQRYNSAPSLSFTNAVLLLASLFASLGIFKDV